MVGPPALINQSDLTRLCAEAGDGTFEVFAQWDWDNRFFPPNGSTANSCSLYDTDCDGNANLAVCVTIRGGASPTEPTLGAVRLFTCDDSGPDRCGGAVTVVPGNRCVGGSNPNSPCTSESQCLGGGVCMPAPSKHTTCSVAAMPNDPFNNSMDTVATCSVDIDDFDTIVPAVDYEGATVVDSCSYGSELGLIGAPIDCIQTTCTTDAQCDDNNASTTDTCNAGRCTHFAAGSACGDGQFCTVGDSCSAPGVCSSGGPRDCSDPNACTVDSCNEATNACLNDAAAANGLSCGNPNNTECDNPDTCLAGTCQPNNEPAGFACGDPSDVECNAPDSCDGSGSCVAHVDPSGSVCRPDAGDCDVADTCDGTSAVCPNNFDPATTPCGDPSDTECTNPDTCDGTGTCLQNNAGAGAACGASSDTECTDPDTCDGTGACSPNDTGAGTPCGDNSDTDCSDPDTCNGTGACSPNNAGAGTACGSPDDTDCTDPDACDDNGVCQPNNAATGTPCNDGQFCTSTDECALGSCVGSGNPCTDTNACTPDKCDEAQDDCVFNQVCDDDDDGEDDDDDGEHDEEDYDHNGDDNDGEDDDECDDDDDEHSGSCILKTTGGGRTYEGSEFGFNAKGVIGSWDKGEFNYRGGNVKIHGKVTQILDAYETPDGGVMKFEVTSKDGSTKYHVTVEDHGEPGKNKDALKIYKVSGPGPAPNTTARQIVKSGNIQWHSSLDEDDED